MKRTLVILVTVMIVFPPFANGGRAATAPDAKHGRFENASPSVDDLIRRFLEALDKKDAAALRHLRTTESEYRNIILPGTVSPGTPRRQYREDVSRYFWGALNGKSAGYEKYLLDTAGGRGPTKVKSVSYKKGETRYADYTAYKQLRLVVEDGTGQEHEIWSGSIAEVDGQYKFISFIRD